jgi:hypothetical protein
MAWTPQNGNTSIRYKSASGVVSPAVIVSVTNPTTVTLRIGRPGTNITSVSKIASRTAAGPGWYHAGR